MFKLRIFLLSFGLLIFNLGPIFAANPAPRPRAGVQLKGFHRRRPRKSLKRNVVKWLKSHKTPLIAAGGLAGTAATLITIGIVWTRCFNSKASLPAASGVDGISGGRARVSAQVSGFSRNPVPTAAAMACRPAAECAGCHGGKPNGGRLGVKDPKPESDNVVIKERALGGVFHPSFFVDGVLDLGLVLFGTQEKQLKKIDTRQSLQPDALPALLTYNIAIFNKDSNFWRKAGVSDAEEKAVMALAAGKATEFNFLKDSCFQLWDRDELNRQFNEAKVFEGEHQPLKILVGAPIQWLTSQNPQNFNGAVVQTGSTETSFEGAVQSGGTMSECENNAVQGETVAIQNAYASFYRQYILKPILVAKYPERFKSEWTDEKGQRCVSYGIHLGYQAANTKIAFQKPAEVAFVARPADATVDTRHPDVRYAPALALRYDILLSSQNVGADFQKPLLQEGSGGVNHHNLNLLAYRTPMRIAQACSFAINLGGQAYRDDRNSNKAEDAKNLLINQMRGAVRAAAVNGYRRIYLTPVGRGAFLNPIPWFAEALALAVQDAQTKNMEVFLVVYEPPAPWRIRTPENPSGNRPEPSPWLPNMRVFGYPLSHYLASTYPFGQGLRSGLAGAGLNEIIAGLGAKGITVDRERDIVDLTSSPSVQECVTGANKLIGLEGALLLPAGGASAAGDAVSRPAQESIHPTEKAVNSANQLYAAHNLIQQARSLQAKQSGAPMSPPGAAAGDKGGSSSGHSAAVIGVVGDVAGAIAATEAALKKAFNQHKQTILDCLDREVVQDIAAFKSIHDAARYAINLANVANAAATLATLETTLNQGDLSQEAVRVGAKSQTAMAAREAYAARNDLAKVLNHAKVAVENARKLIPASGEGATRG